jgi:hypothetical protein
LASTQGCSSAPSESFAKASARVDATGQPSATGVTVDAAACDDRTQQVSQAVDDAFSMGGSCLASLAHELADELWFDVELPPQEFREYPCTKVPGVWNPSDVPIRVERSAAPMQLSIVRRA